jgi:hypothetical protein
MIKRLNKSGQFYLIAAIVIISLIVGFFLISNYSKKKENVRVYELSEQLKIEGKKVVDYGIINDNTKVKEFTKNFSDYAGEGIDIVYITGNCVSNPISNNDCNLNVFRYNSTGEENVNYTKAGNDLTIKSNAIAYVFHLNIGEIFYFLMTQNTNGEIYVARN